MKETRERAGEKEEIAIERACATEWVSVVRVNGRKSEERRRDRARERDGGVAGEREKWRRKKFSSSSPLRAHVLVWRRVSLAAEIFLSRDRERGRERGRERKRESVGERGEGRRERKRERTLLSPLFLFFLIFFFLF